MFSSEFVGEFRTHWLPQISTPGLKRLIELVDTNSRKLIHRSFTDGAGGGCLASHAAWTHPGLKDQSDSPHAWLRLIGCHSCTVITEWDGLTFKDLKAGTYREHLLALLTEELHKRETSGTLLHDELLGRAGPCRQGLNRRCAGSREPMAELPPQGPTPVDRLIVLGATLGRILRRVHDFARLKFLTLGERFEAFLDGLLAASGRSYPTKKAGQPASIVTMPTPPKQIPTVVPAVRPFLVCLRETLNAEQRKK